MAKAHNYEIAISDPEYIDNEAFWSIYDFGIGKRITTDDWKPVSNGSAEKSTDELRKALAASKNIVSFAIDDIDLTKPINKNFPRLTVGKHYDQVLVHILAFQHGRLLNKGEKYVDTGDGHSTGGGEFGVIDNFSLGLITLYHVTVLQTKVLSAPAGLFPMSARTFSSAVCKVTAARFRK